ncbi:uncharacterized protein [Triticum aestivum]|uniref:uncharacterized protein n=1 Tax=Triticum aestivum TaxID=4565 RepID=UPI001D02375D|nr:uncharacterized protein LOC123063647 [Triticum aestivum]
MGLEAEPGGAPAAAPPQPADLTSGEKETEVGSRDDYGSPAEIGRGQGNFTQWRVHFCAQTAPGIWIEGRVRFTPHSRWLVLFDLENDILAGDFWPDGDSIEVGHRFKIDGFDVLVVDSVQVDLRPKRPELIDLTETRLHGNPRGMDGDKAGYPARLVVRRSSDLGSWGRWPIDGLVASSGRWLDLKTTRRTRMGMSRRPLRQRRRHLIYSVSYSIQAMMRMRSPLRWTGSCRWTIRRGLGYTRTTERRWCIASFIGERRRQLSGHGKDPFRRFYSGLLR